MSRARLCIQPVVRELAHAGVDDRIAGAALAPGVEVLVRRRPTRAWSSRWSVARVGRVMEQDVSVESRQASWRANASRSAARLQLARARCSRSAGRPRASTCRRPRRSCWSA